MAEQKKGDEAVEKILESLELTLKYGSKHDVIRVYNSLGKLYYNLGEYRKSIESFLKEIEIRTEINDIDGLALASHNLGRTHRTIGNFQLALEQFQKSLTYSEKLGDKTYIAANCNEIGLTYESLSRSELSVEDNEVNFRKALEFHERALNLYQELEDLANAGRSMNNIANNYSRLAINQFVSQYGEFWEDSIQQVPSNVVLSTFGKTIEYYNRALEIFEKIDETLEIANVNINLGSHYSYARDWKKTNQYLNQSGVVR